MQQAKIRLVFHLAVRIARCAVEQGDIRVQGMQRIERGGEPACHAYVRTCGTEGVSAEAEFLPVGDGQVSDGPGGAVWLVVHGLASPLEPSACGLWPGFALRGNAVRTQG